MKTYGRLGTTATLRSQVAEAQNNGATVVRDNDSATVEVYLGNAIAFRAVKKDAAIWLFLYNPKFYPLPAL